MKRITRMGFWIVALIALVAVIPVAAAAIVAGVSAARVGKDPIVRSASVLVDAAEARQPFSIRLSRMFGFDQQYDECGIKLDDMGDYSRGKSGLDFEGWSSREAAIRLDATLGGYYTTQLRNARANYIGRNTSEFSRHFLLGCMEGTVFAGLCANYVTHLIERFDRIGPQGWERERLDRIEAWNRKTMCSFLRGARQPLKRAAPAAKGDSQ